ncbi:MAG TPA: hypothetical protein VNI54_04845 [Thermoanaerobaculia bacterium]|nr:hypothetical protein [Thermoanaerobaculia bacterium]
MLFFFASVAAAGAATFSVEPTTSPAAGGQRVRLVFNTSAQASKVKSVQFGRNTVKPFERIDHVIALDTPVYDGSGQQTQNGFTVRIGINETPTDVLFTYLNENTPASGPARQDRDKEVSRGPDPVAMTIDPAYGTFAGGAWVTLHVVGRTAACSQPQIFFEKIAVSSQPLGASTFRVSTPAMEIAPGQTLRPVNVSLQCNGNAVASGTFLYVAGTRSPPQTIPAWIVLTIICIILASCALWFHLHLMEKRLSALIAAKRPATVPPDPMPLLTEIVARLRDFDKDQPPPPPPPSPGKERVMDQSGDRESIEELSDRALMTEEQPASAGESTERRRVREAAPAPAPKLRPRSDAGAAELTAIWNSANDTNRSDQEFMQLVSAGVPAKCDFRSTSGLIVVVPKGAEFAWVVPEMDPMLHRPALREFFEIRSGNRSTVTLICPATMPKDVDVNGFTAGQIMRGVIER